MGSFKWIKGRGIKKKLIKIKIKINSKLNLRFFLQILLCLKIKL